MLSRVANSIYWICRYIERAENYARFIDVNHRLTMDLPPWFEEQWLPLIETTGDIDVYKRRFGEDYSKDTVIDFLVFDNENPNSIISCLSSARENARTVREIISSEMWLQINELYLNIKHGMSNKNLNNLTQILNSVKLGGHTFDGIMDASLSHGEGWHFGIMGRHLERADKTARTLDMKYYYLLPKVLDINTPLDLLQWSALLRSASAYEMYRKQHGNLSVNKIIAFLALDRAFPRSMLHCIVEATKSLHAINGTSTSTFSTEAEKVLGKMRSEMEYTDIEDILNQGLHEYLDTFQRMHNHASTVIFDTFFSAR